MVMREVKIDIFDHIVLWMQEEKQIQVTTHKKRIAISQGGSFCVKNKSNQQTQSQDNYEVPRLQKLFCSPTKANKKWCVRKQLN